MGKHEGEKKPKLETREVYKSGMVIRKCVRRKRIYSFKKYLNCHAWFVVPRLQYTMSLDTQIAWAGFLGGTIELFPSAHDTTRYSGGLDKV